MLVEEDADNLAVTATGVAVGADVDNAAVLTYSVGVASDTLPSAPPSTSTVNGQYGSLSINNDGTYTYTLDPDAAQSLSSTSSVEEKFSIYVQDEQGAWTSQDISVIALGTNDNPIITSSDDITLIEAGVGVNTDGTASENPNTPFVGTSTASGVITATDVDDGAVLSYAIDGDGIGTYGTLILDAATGEYTYTLNNNATKVNALAANDDTITENFTIQVSDGLGGITLQDISVTIIGTNDAPTLWLYNATMNINRQDNDTTVSSTAFGSDVDTDATLSYSVGAADATAPTENSLSTEEQYSTKGQYGTFTIDANGVYRYTVDTTKTSFLGHDDTATEEFTVFVQDEYGAWATKSVTVNILGKNDAPTFSNTSTTLPTLVEAGVGNTTDNDPNAINTGVSTATIQVTATDLDNDTLTYSVENYGMGIYGVLMPNGVTTNEFIYFLYNNENVVNSLKQGEVVTESFAVTVSDGHGGTAVQYIIAMIIGTNDQPVLTLSDNSMSITESVTQSLVTVSGIYKGSDVDTDAVLTYGVSTDDANPTDATVAEGSYGSLSIADNGTYTYSLDPTKAQSLVEGEVQTETFVIYVQDEYGAWQSQTVTVSVNGIKNPPELSNGEAPDALLVDESAMAQGTNAQSTAECAQGTVSFNVPNGLSTISLGGVELTFDDVGQAYDVNGDAVYSIAGSAGILSNIVLTDHGDLSYTLSYTYTQTEAVTHATSTEGYDATDIKENADSFALIITGGNGNTLNSTIVVNSIDDAPIAPESDTVITLNAADANGTSRGYIGMLDFGADDGIGASITVNGVTATWNGTTWTGDGLTITMQGDTLQLDFGGVILSRVPTEVDSSTGAGMGTKAEWLCSVDNVSPSETVDTTIIITDADGDTASFAITAQGADYADTSTDLSDANIITSPSDTYVTTGTSYNISIILDTSGSMGQTRMEACKDAVMDFIENTLLPYAQDALLGGTVCLQFVSFSTNVGYNVFVTLDSQSTAESIAAILATIDSCYASGFTYYDNAFTSSAAWFAEQDNDYVNKTFFITDGVPTSKESSNITAFDALQDAMGLDTNVFSNEEGDAIYAVGIGSGISESVLEPYGEVKVLDDENISQIFIPETGSNAYVATESTILFAAEGDDVLIGDLTTEQAQILVQQALNITLADGSLYMPSTDDVINYVRAHAASLTDAGLLNDTDALIGSADNDVLLGQGSADMLIGDGTENALELIGTSLGLTGYDTATLDTLSPTEGQEAVTYMIDTLQQLSDTKVSNIITLLEKNMETDSDGNDALYGGSGDDVLIGLGGDDTLWGGDGDDLLLGGSGDDIFYGEAGNDRLFGGSGNDIFILGVDDILIDGGDGDMDILLGGLTDRDIVETMLTNDTLVNVEMIVLGNTVDTDTAQNIVQSDDTFDPTGWIQEAILTVGDKSFIEYTNNAPVEDDRITLLVESSRVDA